MEMHHTRSLRETQTLNTKESLPERKRSKKAAQKQKRQSIVDKARKMSNGSTTRSQSPDRNPEDEDEEQPPTSPGLEELMGEIVATQSEISTEALAKEINEQAKINFIKAIKKVNALIKEASEFAKAMKEEPRYLPKHYEEIKKSLADDVPKIFRAADEYLKRMSKQKAAKYI